MARAVTRSAALVLLSILALLASPGFLRSQTTAAAYRRRFDADAATDYLSALTEQDLRLMLAERGMEVAEEATREDLVKVVRDLDRAASLTTAAAKGGPSEGTAALRPVNVKVLYCVG
jgi:type II secretory pathway pseudopilin PulG